MLGLLGAAMILAPSAASSKLGKVAVFDFQFARGTPVELTEEDLTLLKRTSNAFRRLLQESGRFEFVPFEAEKAEVEKMGDIRAYTDTYAKTLGASATFVREVQKVSNLILNMNVHYKYLGGEARE